MFASVALNIPANKLFTYAIPENLQSAAQIGKRVFVPFGSRKRTGFIVGLSPSCALAEIKTISEILDQEALFDEDNMKFYSWISEYFIYPLGKTLGELIPSGAGKKDIQWIISAIAPTDSAPTYSQKKILDIVEQHPQGLSVRDLIRKSNMKNAAAVIRSLSHSGLAHIIEKEKKQLAIRTQKIINLQESVADQTKFTARQQSVVDCLKKDGPADLHYLMEKAGATATILKKLLEKGVLTVSDEEVIRKTTMNSTLRAPRQNLTLNDEQTGALDAICRMTGEGVFHPVLLHGVTGSGKTEVYLAAINHVLKTGGTAIYLVPEIALTPQLISRITGRFDADQIAVIHSGIAESVRYDQWRQMRRGQINLVIGARSALFAPLPNLRLIIVDEEHDGSYKQDGRLCYHARDLAVVRAKLTGAVCVLGSATPGLRTFYNARSQKYAHLELTRRVNNKPLPQIDIIDMKEQKEVNGKMPIISDALAIAIAETLIRKEQALLFLNKRGFDTFLVCGDCGYNFTCPNCAVALKSHLAENLVKCHYCDYTQKAMPLCPHCRGSRILNYGAGTQKLEKTLEILFPQARICRMDSDTTSRKGSQEKILHALEQKEIDILLGTQMITKGHDFPFITLVGVISADTSLNMPDFRAAEKTFQMLTQVAGRGGRGAAAGRVIIQTFNPQHYALKHTKGHDYQAFYAEEIELRRALNYPPFSRIINLRLSSVKQNILIATAADLGRDARALCQNQRGSLEIIGPAEAPLSKIRGEHRMQMLIKGQDSKALHLIAAALLEKHATSTVKITIDVDPENFM